ncbi:MAG: type II secretion system protein GspN [bacterium]|nr:type II secretion system protein GspN [bacterium]MCP5067913.1 type II secretion system protein GspN [bacterium]
MTSADFPGNSHGGRMRGFAIALGCLILTLVFAVAQFPWDRLTPWLVTELEQATGTRMEVAELGSSWAAGGPAADLQGLVLHFPGEAPIAIDRLRIRPALSTSWLDGEPALTLDLALAGGQLTGTLWPTGAAGFDGSFEDIATADLPEFLDLTDLPLDGVLSGKADVRQQQNRWVGDVSILGNDGSLILPGLAIALPFDQLTADLSLREEAGLAVEELRFEGPMASFDAEGTVALDAAGRPGVLDLTVTVWDVDPSLRGMALSQGFRLDSNGEAKVSISGAVSAPRIELR